MNVRTRALAYAGAAAAGLVAAGALAAPALAAGPTDLSLSLSGTTLAATASGKAAFATVTNKGAEAATDVIITFDLSDLDTSVVEVPLPDPGACAQSGKRIACAVESLKAGATIDLPFLLLRAGDGTPGKLTVSVSHGAEDPQAGNDTATAAVTVSESSGSDLTVVAPDAPLNDEGVLGTAVPGEETQIEYIVVNFGDQAVSGLRLTIRLPEHVTFVEREAGCAYTADNRTATCTYDFGLVPADDEPADDEPAEGGPYAAAGFVNRVKVSEDAPGPAVLDGGIVTAEGLGVEEVPEVAARIASKLPAGVEGVSAKDIDESDNSDEFSVHVAAGGGGGGGGELPVTGVQAGLIGGVGLAVVGGGIAMLLVSRRRRIVLAVPDDERPTA